MVDRLSFFQDTDRHDLSRNSSTMTFFNKLNMIEFTP